MLKYIITKLESNRLFHMYDFAVIALFYVVVVIVTKTTTTKLFVFDFST